MSAQIRTLRLQDGRTVYVAGGHPEIRIREATILESVKRDGFSMTTYIVERYHMAGEWGIVAKVPGWMAIPEFDDANLRKSQGEVE